MRWIVTLVSAAVFVVGLDSSVFGQQRESLVTSSQDRLLAEHETSSLVFKKVETEDVTTYFHRREIGEATVEKDFIRSQIQPDTGELIESSRRWRAGLPASFSPSVTKRQAESRVEGEVVFSKLYIISPDSNVFRFTPTPENPCWVVSSLVGDRLYERGPVAWTVFDAVTGEKLGYGVPPPYEGLSIYGPDHGACPQDPIDGWGDFADNAESWFENMGYDTRRVGNATVGTIQGHIQSDSTAMFFELNHGGSSSFHNVCDDNITAADIEAWISAHATIPFTFLASCGGMCDQTDDHFSFEFRKGSEIDAVTIGYCGMSTSNCSDCWTDALDWQDELLDRMSRGQSAAYAFSRANGAYPDCSGSNNCMRFAGDRNLVFGGPNHPVVQRSLCGPIFDVGTASPLYPFKDILHTRAHHIRCNSYVPSDKILTVGSSASHPYVEVVFLNDAKLSSHGVLVAKGRSGEVTFVSENDRRKGMKVKGELRASHGGEIKVY